MEARRDAAPVAAQVTVEYDWEQGRRRLRGARNGLPDFVPYARGAPRAAWAVRAVRQSIAEHGEPRLRQLCSGLYTCD